MTVASLLRWWGPLIAYMVAIFWASSGARPQVMVGTPDYVLHVVEYFGLAVLFVRALGRGLAKPVSPVVFWLGLALAFAYGVSDEWHQSFVSSRVASLRDVAADGVGVVLGGAFVSGVVWKERLPSRLASFRRGPDRSRDGRRS